MKLTINIAIAEDHGLLRQGMVALLKPYKQINVLFDVSNGVDMIKLLNRKKKPNVVLLDINMPDLNGQEVLLHINKKHLRIKAIIISSYYEPEYITAFFKLGAKAFLPKEEKIEKVVEAITSVHIAGFYNDARVAEILAKSIENDAVSKKSNTYALTPSELGILNYICKGLQQKEIAFKLGIKEETVNFHVGNMYRKTNTNNAATLVAHAIKNKLINIS
jgi:DNA-binding NarL/FixJ family response regulator